MGAGGVLTLRCKNFESVQLEIPLADDCINIALSVEQLSNIGLVVFTSFYCEFNVFYPTVVNPL